MLPGLMQKGVYLSYTAVTALITAGTALAIFSAGSLIRVMPWR